MSYTAPELPQHVYGEANIKLGKIEAEEDVTILFAVESGSRAWGFPSPDSDNDVRFFYSRPASKYLGLEYPKDTIERPVNDIWDLNGWDIRKALQLLVKGNATPAEWLSSPLIYREHGPVPYKLRTLIRKHASPASSAKHYYGLTNTCFKKDIEKGVPVDGARAFPDFPKVNQKKYLYAVRGALALSWIEKFGVIPPMSMPALLAEDICSWDERSLIQQITDRKKTMGEFGDAERIPILDRFISGTLEWVKTTGMDKSEVSPEFVRDANALLLEALGI